MTLIKNTSALLLLCLVITGCATQKELYHWGSYEGLVRNMYVAPDKATATIQIDQLNLDIQKSESEGKNPPPGVYAHLGMMYASIDQADSAIDALQKEKAAYPESSVLIETLLRNNKGVQK
ncbi:DUF4810 domain-containing protein [Neptunomonas japonica]|uniref:DUF4810 domain-containing protein n=1 Tax=Neptunomonas japonica TaxID=417574 RepID=UPI00040EAA01|nr:DUF4810 domain-containing protein [Neptunomonas japonica]